MEDFHASGAGGVAIGTKGPHDHRAVQRQKVGRRNMTFVDKHRFEGGRTEEAMLKIVWDGELFGVGMFETLA